MQKSTSVEGFIASHPEWREPLCILREILRSTGLDETIKWGVPVYTLDGKNVAGLTAFKKFIAIWFFQGALLQDPTGKLINAQEGKTRAQRQWRFDDSEPLDGKLIRQYLEEAISNQRRGKTIRPATNKPPATPRELSDAMNGNSGLKKSFARLTAYKQREYTDYLVEAKRADTRQRRLGKIIPLILAGKGLNDCYRS